MKENGEIDDIEIPIAIIGQVINDFNARISISATKGGSTKWILRLFEICVSKWMSMVSKCHCSNKNE